MRGSLSKSGVGTIGKVLSARRTRDIDVRDVASWNVTDFSTTILSDVVITQHALDVLREEGLTGFEVRPVEIDKLPLGKRRLELPRVWEFVVTGTAGPAHKASGLFSYGDAAHVDLWTYPVLGL